MFSRKAIACLSCAALFHFAPAFTADTAANEPAVPDLLSTAKNTNESSKKRIQAVIALERIKEPDVINNHVCDSEGLLGIATGDPDPFVRESAIRTLGHLERTATNTTHLAKEHFIDPFSAILRKPGEDPMLRGSIADVFGETLIPGVPADTDRAFSALVDVATCKDIKETQSGYPVKLKCIKAIGSFASPRALEVLMTLLNDSDPITKEMVATAIYDLLNKSSEVSDRVTQPTVVKLESIMKDPAAAVYLRIAVMKALAKLIHAGNREAENAFDDIVAVRLTAKPDEEGDKLVMGSIEALGIIASSRCVDPIKKIYDDYYKKGEEEKASSIPFRRAAVEALESVLAFQGLKKQVDAATVTEAAKLLRKIIDGTKTPPADAPLPDNPETLSVRGDAIFSMRYLLKYAVFEREHQSSFACLIDVLINSKEPEELRNRAAETLIVVTGLDVFKNDKTRWIRWYQEKYGRSQAQ